MILNRTENFLITGHRVVSPGAWSLCATRFHASGTSALRENNRPSPQGLI